MATRNLTSRFELFRAQCRTLQTHTDTHSFLQANSKKFKRKQRQQHTRYINNSHFHPHSPDSSQAKLIEDQDISDVELCELNSTVVKQTPAYVDLVDDIESLCQLIREDLSVLVSLHAERLKVSFGEDVITRQDTAIEAQTANITRQLRQAENKLKQIASKNSKASQQDRQVRLNVMRSLGLQLQALSKEFRRIQTEFMKSLRQQEAIGQHFGFDSQQQSNIFSLTERAAEQGLTQQELQVLQEMEEQATQREREILRIAQSVNDLASLFRELNVLVIEQGSILDRIDYNVEQSLVKIQSGVKQLQAADAYSKKARTFKCILCLVIFTILLLFILFLKHR